MAPTAIGRPVRAVSISFQGLDLDEVVRLVDAEGACGADLIALPETFLGQDGPPQTLEGEIICAMSELARQHSTYIVCPMDRQADARRLNSAVLLDRDGHVVCVYDKVFPYWSEFDITPAVQLGEEAPVYETDFGKIGMAICFDANFPEVWRRLADQGAELVVWPSAYSAGTTLQAHALTNHFYVLSCTQSRDCILYDITGEEILYHKSPRVNTTRVTLDLDRGIYHQNFNTDKLEKLLAEHGEEVCREHWLEREQWFVLRATRPGVSARGLAREYGLEELRDYINRSRADIDGMRGWRFADAD